MGVSQSQRIANRTFARSVRGPVFGPCMGRASVRFASRRDRETTIRPRHGAACHKCCVVIWWN
eukprot:11215878-Lingulodinium_polyedra.AAC.1